MLPLLVCAAFFASASAYSIPDPEFEVLKPGGLKVSIPNDDGIQVFSFHGNINREMTGLESGQISQDVSTTENGKFTVYDENINLQNGDVIYYWLYVVCNGLAYQLNNGKFVYQQSNEKSRGCPPGYRKKVKVADGTPQNDEVVAWSSADHDEMTGSDGLHNYHRFYEHGFRPDIYYGRPWYPFYGRGHWHHHFNGPRRGRGHSYWHRRNHNYHDNRFGDVAIPGTEHISPIVKRNADSEEDDKNESGDIELESRFGSFSHGFGGANFIHPQRPAYKPYRSHGYGYHGHGNGHDYGHGYNHGRGHGYGLYHGHRPHGPPYPSYPAGLYPSHPGFGKDQNKFNDYYDCEEDDSSEGEKTPEPINFDTTMSPKIPEEPSTTSSTTSTTTTSTTTTTTTERTSTFPQIDIRFGNS